MDLGISGRVALVTGASRGIGRACAFALAREGAQIAIAARGQDQLDETAAELRDETGAKVLSVAADVGKAADIERLAEDVLSEYGNIDVLVAICGSPARGGFDDLADSDFTNAFEATTMAVVRLVRAVVPSMRDRKWGRIVSVQSRSVKERIPALAASNATRPGVAGLMKDISVELGPHGILVNTVVPGRIMTDRLREGARHAGGADDEYFRRQVSELPVGRLGEPEEMADAVAFLASERASYITGTTVHVDGGLIRSFN